MRTAKVLSRLAGVTALFLLLCLSQTASAEDPIRFNDANLKAAVEAALGKANPTPTDMLALTELDVFQTGVTDLAGLQYATNLTSLWLMCNQIRDLSPLAGLTHLTELGLDENQISDLSPLAGLTGLTALWLDGNQIRDLSPLVQLTSLTDLTLAKNKVSDLSPLRGLTHLTVLWLDGNQIHDISPLVDLTHLEHLDLWNNPLYEQACTIHIPQILANNPGIALRYDPCIDQCILTISSTAGGSVTNPGEGSFQYLPGTVVPIVAESESGCLFAGWTGTAVDAMKVTDPASASTVLTMDNDYTLQANFQAADEVSGRHTLTISCGEGGWVTTPGEGAFRYAHGTSASVVATPVAHYHLMNWTGTAVTAGKVANAASASTTVMMDNDYTLRANFQADAEAGQHLLTVICGEGGSVTTEVVSGPSSKILTGAGAFVVDDGVEVAVTAVARAGWRFTNWSGEIASSESTCAFTLTSDQRLEAHFEQSLRTLAITCGQGGTVTMPGVGSFNYERGVSIPVEAAAEPGYRFAGWTGTVVDRKDIGDARLSRTSVIAYENGTLHANFEALRSFHESWEAATIGSYDPSKASFISGDEGVWFPEDAVSKSATCGPTPQRAEILKLDSGQALLLTSADSKSLCSDIASISLIEAKLVNPGFALPVDANTFLSFYEVGQLNRPELHDPAQDCAVPPCFDNVSLLLSDNKGNILAYVLQRYPDTVANVPNAHFGGTYREILLDPSGLYYRRNLLSDLRTIPSFDPLGAQVRSIEFRVDEHGLAIIDEVTIGPGASDRTVPIYRFWSPVLECHFFTAGAAEKQNLIDLYPSIWAFEGIAYFALGDGGSEGAAPVFRCWSPVLESHFYTINEAEKDMLVRDFPDVWTLEGVAFYAYPEGRQPADACPVYRFWSGILSCHFYTTSETERDYLVRNFAHVWTLEGAAWYAYPPRWDPGQALAIVHDSRTPGDGK